MLNNPVALERTLAAIGLVGLSTEDHVLDIGCGTGEILVELGASGIPGTGVDRDAAAIAEAQSAAAGLPLTFLAADVQEAALPSASLVLCIGATHAFAAGLASLPAALQVCGALVRSGGHLLIGEGCRRQPLPDGYRAFLGEPTGIERTHAENVAVCEEHGWTCMHALTASVPEWDAFEFAHFRRGTLGDRARAWRDAYLKWGRDTIGFGLYLLERAP